MAVKGKVLWLAGVPFVLLLLAGLVAYLAYFGVQDTSGRSVVFPNGSRLTVLGASLNGRPFTTDKPWQSALRRWLPAKWRGWLPELYSVAQGDRNVPETMGSNSLAVWFTYVDARGSNMSPWISSLGAGVPSPTPGSWMFIAAEAADGFRFGPLEHSDESLVAAGGRNLWVNRLWLEHFPRRQREFELEFFDGDKHPMGSVSVPNAANGPFPEWTPERLPIVRTNEPLVVTLQSLEESGKASRRTPFDFGRGSDQTRWAESPTMGIVVQFRLQTTDPDWEQAYIPGSRVQWSDATGNADAPLDNGEKAWKLYVEFRRSNPTHYAEAERLVLSGLTIPEPGTVQVLTNEFERLGRKFKLSFLAAAGTLAITNASSKAAPGGGALRNSTARSIGTVLKYGLRGGNVAYSGPNPNPRTPGFVAGTGVHMLTMTRPFFLLEASPLGPLEAVRFHVFASDGEELLPQGLPETVVYGSQRFSARSTNAPENDIYVIEFAKTNITGTISLEIALDRARTFEFFIDPKEVKRAAK